MKRETIFRESSPVVLKIAAQKLLEAGSEIEAEDALGLIRSAMEAGPTDKDVQSAIRLLKEALRDAAVALAQEAYNNNPALFPKRTQTLFQELSSLLDKCLGHGNWMEDSDSGVRYSLNGLSQCETPASVRDFVSRIYSATEKNLQTRRESLLSLLNALKDEIISDYLKVLDSLTDHTQHQRYILSLLSTLEIVIHYIYPLNLLYYGKETFEVITATTLLTETDILQLRKKLRVMCNSMSVMKPQVLEWYTDEIRWDIPEAAIRFLKISGVESKLPDDVRFCMTCLEAVYDAEVTRAAALPDFPPEPQALTNLLDAQSMLRAMCVHHDIESLKHDWQEFLDCVGSCPGCSGMLERQARETLSTHILSAMLKLSDTPLAETMLCLVRLYLVLTFSATRITYDEELFNWIIFGR